MIMSDNVLKGPGKEGSSSQDTFCIFLLLPPFLSMRKMLSTGFGKYSPSGVHSVPFWRPPKKVSLKDGEKSVFWLVNVSKIWRSLSGTQNSEWEQSKNNPGWLENVSWGIVRPRLLLGPSTNFIRKIKKTDRVPSTLHPMFIQHLSHLLEIKWPLLTKMS